MAKISKSALYLPRFLAMEENEKDKNMTDEDKERELILAYGIRIDLTTRNLRYADLQSSILTRADMRERKFDAANLSKSHMQAVDLTNASFIDAILREAKLQDATLVKTKLQRASLVSANMNDALFEDCNLSGTSLQKAQLKQVKFMGKTNLENADLRNAVLTNATLDSINLTGASLHNADITAASFNNSTLTAADLSGVYFYVQRDKIVNTFFDQGFPFFKETKMFGINISENKKQEINSTKKEKQYINLVKSHLTKSQQDFAFNTNISKENSTFHARRIKYLENTIVEIEENNESKERLKKLEEILNTSCSKNVKNKDCNNSENDVEKYLKIIYDFIST